MTLRVLVVGGGVAGLMSAWILQKSGCRTTLLDRQHTGGEASWAGGGILSPLYPWRHAPAINALSRLSIAQFPILCDELARNSGVDPELHRTGMLMLNTTDADAAAAWASAEGVKLESVTPARMARLCPPMGKGFDNGLWMPEVGNVRNPRLLHALRGALLATGGIIHEDSEVTELRSGGGAPSVLTRDGRLHEADHVVICAGAWSRRLLEGHLNLPVEPVKGQMLLYRAPSGWLTSMLMHEGKYLIPRRDGLVLCRSTVEHTGFDKSVSESARDTLQEAAHRLCPALASQPLVQQWAGLRPASPEGIPWIGPLPGMQGVWVNTGHFRNGLVMAPASAMLLRDLLLGRKPELDPAPYRPL